MKTIAWKRYRIKPFTNGQNWKHPLNTNADTETAPSEDRVFMFIVLASRFVQDFLK